MTQDEAYAELLEPNLAGLSQEAVDDLQVSIGDVIYNPDARGDYTPPLTRQEADARAGIVLDLLLSLSPAITDEMVERAAREIDPYAFNPDAELHTPDGEDPLWFRETKQNVARSIARVTLEAALGRR